MAATKKPAKAPTKMAPGALTGLTNVTTGAAAKAEMARMERESSKSKSKTKGKC